MTVPVQVSKHGTAGKTTQGVLNFTLEELTDGGKVPYSQIVRHEDGSRTRESNTKVESKQVEVHDTRTANKSFSLQKEGFILRHLEVPASLDWQNDEQVSLPSQQGVGTS